MQDLIFDIGMHNGDDTHYYLSRNHRVVAVEADPLMCAAARQRFAAQIDTGQLSVRNIGIAETRGEMEFWVSSHSEWSSFHRQNATKDGAEARSIRVQTMPFEQLIEEEGVPLYAKIDIEMNDSLCVEGIAASGSRPSYVSMEFNFNTETDIRHLTDLGYSGFKCVRQNDWREITPRNVVFQEEVRRALLGLERGPRPARRLRPIVERAHYRPRTLDGWRFNPGSSGPLANELPGRWLSSEEMLSVWHQLVAYDLRLATPGLGEWFDVHAAHEAVR
jgi:FkbM family methyltransferase